MLEALAVARALGSNDMCVDAATDLIDVAPHVSGELRSRIDAEVEATAAEPVTRTGPTLTPASSGPVCTGRSRRA